MRKKFFIVAHDKEAWMGASGALLVFSEKKHITVIRMFFLENNFVVG